MRILIQQVKIFCNTSPFHLQKMDLLIEDGKITEIAAKASADVDKVVKGDGLCVSLGWYDAFADFAEPGYGNRETLLSGANAASAGGYTDVQLMPNTSPPINNRAMVDFLTHHSLPVKIHPIGKVTNEKGGLNEMYDMQMGGAIAFSNGDLPVQSTAILLKALQYLIPTNTPLIQVPGETDLSANGLMHEGVMSTQLGLPGIPAIAEEMMIMRDLELVRYTGASIHFTGVSTGKGLSMIQAAKAEGLKVTCSTTAYQTIFSDEDLKNYDTTLKVFPPLRTKEDRDAIRECIINGTVDCIASHHIPRHSDEKLCEFDQAAYGMAIIQNTFAVLRSWTNEIEKIVTLLTAARSIFMPSELTIDIGQTARLTLFYPDETYTFTKEMNRSLSMNNPFIGKKLTGKVAGSILENQIHLTV